MNVEAKASPAVRVKVTHSDDNNWYAFGDEFEVLPNAKLFRDAAKGLEYYYYPLPDKPHIGVDVEHCERLYSSDSCIKPLDAHYSFDYTLTEDDKKAGKIKVDPYFVAKQWQLGKKDDTGVLFHCLKNISRYSDKNSKEREIKALSLQVKRLAELEGVALD